MAKTPPRKGIVADIFREVQQRTQQSQRQAETAALENLLRERRTKLTVGDLVAIAATTEGADLQGKLLTDIFPIAPLQSAERSARARRAKQATAPAKSGKPPAKKPVVTAERSKPNGMTDDEWNAQREYDNQVLKAVQSRRDHEWSTPELLPLVGGGIRPLRRALGVHVAAGTINRKGERQHTRYLAV